MSIGFSKDEIMSMLDSHLSNVSQQLDSQVNKFKEEKADTEFSLSALLTTSMLSVLESVSAIIEINNKKILEDLTTLGVITKP